METPTHTTALPHWDLTTLYSGLEAEDFQADFAAWSSAVTELTAFFDGHQIGAPDAPLTTDADVVKSLDEAIKALNDVEARAHKLYAYLSGRVATNSRDTEAQAWLSRLQIRLADLEKLDPRFVAWIGALDLDVAARESSRVAAHAYALHRAQTEAQHLMSPAEEDLAADLNMTGGRAWSRFYSNYSSQITAEVTLDGESDTLPITAIRNLAYSPERDVRRRAYETELAAWERHAMPIATALNSIKGQANTLNRRRGWQSPLDLALFNNAIDAATLDAMLTTARGFFPEFRRYLKAKARLLGINTCAWYDLFAPVGSLDKPWAFADAADFIVDQFDAFSPVLSGLAKRAFEEHWIDAEPRDGKRGGAFCMWTGGETSRILSNYQTSYGGMSTLAHELGHAFHNQCLAERTYLQRSTPMTLAETASTFCQIIVRNAALRGAPEAEQLAILEADLQDSTQVVVDISSRILFESQVFEQRRERELSADEFCAIMRDSQLDTYGEGLDPDRLHPYMWAVKPHYYSSVFYNFPYMFGLLFGLGVYAQYREAPDGFIDRYQELLSSTGMSSARELAAGFGIDITTPAFWQSSLALIVEDIDRFEALVDSAGSA